MNARISKYKRPKTKIVCTLGPSTESYETLRSLIENGMSVARLNLSHGTLECDDIEASRRFYTELLGLEAVRTSPTTGMLRLNSVMTIAVVQTKSKNRAGLFSHFGLDVDTTDEVDAARKIVIANKEEYGIKKITEAKIHHGTYAFNRLMTIRVISHGRGRETVSDPCRKLSPPTNRCVFAGTCECVWPQIPKCAN